MRMEFERLSLTIDREFKLEYLSVKFGPMRPLSAQSAWDGWAAGGQNSGLAWQSGVGDSGPVGGNDFTGAESWATRLRAKFPTHQHIDICTSFMVHDSVAQVAQQIHNKKPHLQDLTNANIRICQVIPLATVEDENNLVAIRGGFQNSLARRPATRKRQAAWSRDWTMNPSRS